MINNLRAELDVRAFARDFPTANVLRMVQLAEAGRISWVQAAKVAEDSLRKALPLVELSS